MNSMESQTESQNESWELKVIGGPRFIRVQLGLTKLIWTAMGFSALLLMALSQTGSLDTFNWNEAFRAQTYVDRGGLFVAAPLVAAFLFLASLEALPLFTALSRRAFVNLQAAGRMPRGMVSIQSFFVGTLISLSLAEGLALLGFILVSQSKQGAHVIPFAASFIVAWFRAYPTRAKIHQLYFSESD